MNRAIKSRDEYDKALKEVMAEPGKMVVARQRHSKPFSMSEC
jgi:hypothetical protein